MAGTMALSKILVLRENEKNIAQKAYSQSLDSFEKIAKELYDILRRKEDAEETFENAIQSTAPIDRIKEQAAFIERLNNQISEIQRRLQIARADMEQKQAKLSVAHIEVKKFEKVIEVRQEIQDKNAKRMENAFMDEISMTQYLSHKTGD